MHGCFNVTSDSHGSGGFFTSQAFKMIQQADRSILSSLTRDGDFLKGLIGIYNQNGFTISTGTIIINCTKFTSSSHNPLEIAYSFLLSSEFYSVFVHWCNHLLQSQHNQIIRIAVVVYSANPCIQSWTDQTPLVPHHIH